MKPLINPNGEITFVPYTIEDYNIVVASLVSNKANSLGYFSDEDLISWKYSNVPEWSHEAENFIAWRDSVWAYSLAEMEKFLQGQRAQPSPRELYLELETEVPYV